MSDVALVTGAAGALGAEVARALASRGYRLALLDSLAAQARLGELSSSVGGACTVAGDLTDESTWTRAMPEIQKQLGAAPTVAALIAGGWRGGKPLHEETPDDVWRAMLSSNLETVYRSLRAVLPPMTAQKRG